MFLGRMSSVVRSILLGIVILITSWPVMSLGIVTIEEVKNKNVLTHSAQAVLFPLSQQDQTVLNWMKAKLLDLGGVGLAAPQVNYAKKMAVVYIPEEAALMREHVKPYPLHVLINPEYEQVADTTIAHDFESCYSVASKAGKVPRYDKIKVSYYDELGHYHQSIEQGFYARVLQHEIDHLNGILIIDRLTSDCIQGSIEEMMLLRRAQLSEEKKKLFDQLMIKKFKK